MARLRSVVLVLCAVIATWTSNLEAQQKGNIQRLNPATIHAPRGYTHVVVVKAGETVYIAGQVPLDKSGKMVGEKDFEAQVRQVFENLKSALAAVDADFTNVVNMNTYVTDISQIDTYRKVRDEYMKGDLPASTLVEVKSLFRPGVMIEVSAVAVKK